MRTKTLTLAIATSFMLTLSGAAMAQTAAGGGKSEGDMNNPASVKSPSEKGMERATGSATDSKMVPASDGKMAPASGMAPKSSGDSGGNATTGSGAAPSGK